jgi:hypothetical protein
MVTQREMKQNRQLADLEEVLTTRQGTLKAELVAEIER